MLIITFVAMFFTFNSNLNLNNFSGNTTGLKTTQVTVANTTLTVEVADTPEKRAQGLSNKDSLAANAGMLFVFDRADKYRFWMKDMKFPLDFIWINGNSIVDLLPNVPQPDPNTSLTRLPVYEPVSLVDKVLEVNAGFIASQKVKVGDIVQIVQSP